MSTVFLAGLFVRWWIVDSRQGSLNADEAFTGLQAMRILDGDLPVVLEGQAYTAVLDSYAFAPVVAVVGASVVALKFLTTVWWGLAALFTTIAARRFMPHSGAVAAGCLVWLAPGALAVLSTRAYEGYGLGLLATVVTTWLLARVVDDGHRSWRLTVASGVGLGLMFYLHPMNVALAVPLLIVPVQRFWRDVRGWWLPIVGGAVVVNLPLIAWNAGNDWETLRQPVQGDDTWLERLGRFFSGLVPRAFGLRDFDGGWTLGRAGSTAVILLLGAVAAAGAVVMVRRRSSNWTAVWPLVLCWPIMAMFSNMGYVLDGRYAIVAFPFVALAVGAAIGTWGSAVSRAAAIGLWVAVLIVPWSASNVGSRVADPDRNVRRVVERLDEAGFDRLAGNFWWVLPVEYVSDRRIRTAVAGNPYVVRLPDSQALVQASDPSDVAFVFASGDEQVERLLLPRGQYERHEIGRAVLYLPRLMP